VIQLNNQSLKKKLKNILKVDWSDRNTNSDIISILNYIDENEVKIRNSYFELINIISEKKTNGSPLSELYLYQSYYNLWQMSLICEKSFYKSSQITNILKFLAVVDLVEYYMPKELILFNADSRINKIIKNYCSISKINFDVKKEKKSKAYPVKLIYFIKGLLIFGYKFFINIYIKKHKSNYENGEKGALIVSYLTHFDKEKIAKNFYGTALWGDFPETLNQFKLKTNWLHIPINFKNPEKLFKKLKINRLENFSIHNFLYSFLGLKCWLEIIKDYVSISFKSYIIKSKEVFNYKDRVDLSPLFFDDFHSSLMGPVLVENLIFIKSFDAIFKAIPKQKIGFYLQENQGWELALNSAWRKYKHGKLISVQHSTVSFWDLRYYNNYKDYPYKPDVFIVNSVFAKDHFLKLSYDSDQIQILEALRYSKLKKDYYSPKNQNKVLILGDILKKATLEMLETIYSVIPYCSEKIFYFKSHPAQPIRINKEISNINSIDEPLNKLLNKVNTVICPASSGAAVEAFFGNLKTIVYISKGELNTSPLKNFKSVDFFSHSEELKNIINRSNVYNETHSIFLVNEKTPKWNSFLKKLI
jgi:surface carbohydrate biosynthesis protein (TIGR04326 family)